MPGFTSSGLRKNLGAFDFEIGDVFAARVRVSIPAYDGKPPPSADDRTALAPEETRLPATDAVAGFDFGRIE